MKRKVLFIYVDNGGESLAIEYLSSALKNRGHSTDLIIEHLKEPNFRLRLLDRINSFKPDFIAFSVVTDNYKWAAENSKFIKLSFPNLKIMWGGLQVTSCPEEVMSNSFVDYGVIGEGDDTILEIVNNPDNENIDGVWINKDRRIIKNKMRNLLIDLDRLPLPDKEIFYKEAPYRRDKYYCIIGKGCPFSCTYCFNSFMRKLYPNQKWVRKRSVKSVIKELVWAKEKYNPFRVYFADDCLNNDKKWLKEFVEEYKVKVNIPFTGQSHPNFLDMEACNLLKEAGCLKMELGSQACTERKRKNICNRPENNKKIMDAVNNLKEAGILVQVDHIFDLPGETVKEYQEGLMFYIGLKPNQFLGFTLQYYPNTEIMDIGKEYGIINEEIEKQIIKGEKYPDKDLKNQTIKNIRNFLEWIPLLPRWLSRLIVKKKAYYLFKSQKLSKISLYINYFTTLRLLKGFFNSLNKRKIKKEVLLKITKESMKK